MSEEIHPYDETDKMIQNAFVADGIVEAPHPDDFIDQFVDPDEYSIEQGSKKRRSVLDVLVRVLPFIHF